MEVLQGLRFVAFYLFDLRVLSRSCLFVPGLEQQTTQYPLRRQFTMVHEVFFLCQGREDNFIASETRIYNISSSQAAIDQI
ncbi:hypothetical protein [Microcoleus sp. AR_TQ3_B6]|uniref:hypothetical protein n=1 Tax=Microcoleus sp. AR_TQ3_B6 TaxID=3055284 RepID=UPI002FD5CACD